MALLHKAKDSPTAEATQTMRASVGRAEAFVLFFNLWCLWLGLPYLRASRLGIWDLLLATLPILVFVLGLRVPKQPRQQPKAKPMSLAARAWQSLRDHRQDLLLLVATPLLLAISWVHMSERSAALPLGPVGLLLDTFALWAYGAGCLQLRLGPHQRSEIVTEALPSSDQRQPRPRRVHVVALLFGLGALAVGIIAPSTIQSKPTTSAMAWSLLAVTVAAGLAITVAGLSLSKALRPAVPKPPTHLWPLLLLGTVGAALYLWIQRQ